MAERETYWNGSTIERCDCGYVATDADDTDWHYEKGLHDANMPPFPKSGGIGEGSDA